jgi:hypothetical protein
VSQPHSVHKGVPHRILPVARQRQVDGVIRGLRHRAERTTVSSTGQADCHADVVIRGRKTGTPGVVSVEFREVGD